LNSKTAKRTGWLPTWFSNIAGRRRRDPIALGCERLNRKLRCEWLERRELLTATVALGAQGYMTVPVTSSGGSATIISGTAHYGANADLQPGSQIVYTSPTVGTVTGSLNGQITSTTGGNQSDVGTAFTVTVNSIAQSGSSLSGGSNSVDVTAPADLAGSATSLSGTFDVSQFGAASINWTSAMGSGTWTGTATSTNSSPFTVSLTSPYWDSVAENQIDFGFSVSGAWYPALASAYTTPVAYVRAYWASTASSPTSPSNEIGSSGDTTIPIYWNQASGTAEIQNVAGAIPSGANYVLLQVEPAVTPAPQINTPNPVAFNLNAPLVTGISRVAGLLAGGASVTITGAGFTNATAVDFGNLPASFTVNSANQITATSPATTTAGTVNVTVTTSIGTSATSAANQFTYNGQSIVGRTSSGAWWMAHSTTTSFVNQYWDAWNPSLGWQDIQVADVTGNGRSDIVGITNVGQWYVAMNTGTTFVNQYFGSWDPSAGWQFVHLADVTGDGKADVVGMTSGGAWYVGVSNGTSFTFSYWGSWNPGAGWQNVQFANVTGNGMADIVARASSGAWYVAVSNGSSFTTSYWGGWSPSVTWTNVQLADFTGNGMADIVGETSFGAWYVALSNGSSFTTSYWGAWNPSAGWQDVQIGEFAGNGMADIVAMTSGGAWYVAVSNGTSFTTTFWDGWNPGAGWQDVTVADVNGDGKDDIVAMTSYGAWYVAASNGTSFTTSQWGSWNSSAGWQPVLAGQFG
jgi:hypothetical protein